MTASAVHSPAGEAGPFTFEEDLGRAFTGRAAARFRAEAAGEPASADGAGSQETVALDPAWNPAGMDAGGLRIAQTLVDEAGAAGVFGAPGKGWSVELDLVYSIHGSVFLWRVRLPGEIPCSLASRQWQDARSLGSGRTGADGALELLREAVRAASALHAAWRGRPAAVWLLQHVDRHGDDITAHASPESALGALAQTCRSRWDTLPRAGGAPRTGDLLDDAGAVAAYFTAAGGTESYRIWSAPVEGSTAGQAA